MPKERGEVDGKKAVIKPKSDGSGKVDVLYNFDPSLPHGHDHIVIGPDGRSATYVRDEGKVRSDEREFVATAKEELIREAEGLSTRQGFHAAHEKAKKLRSQFKEAGFAGQGTEADLRAHFEAALKRFYDQARLEKEERERRQADSAKKKQALVDRAKSLSSSSDWKATSASFRQLRDEWKAVGSAGRENEEPLWRAFNAAHDRFHQRQDEHFAQLNKDWGENRDRKHQLAREATSLAESSVLRSAFPAMRTLMERWKTIGSAGRDDDERLWKTFQQARDRLHARGEDERQRAELLKKALVNEASSVAVYADLREAGQKWKEIMVRWKKAGPAGRVVDDDLWSRLQGYRRQLDGRYEQSKAQRQQRAREGIQNLEAAAARKRAAIADLDGRIAAIHAKPPIRPGPRQFEFENQRRDKIAQLSSYKAAHQQALSSIETKLRDAYARP